MANPFVHVELRTDDVAKAKAFYSSLFDWKLQDVPMGAESYTTIDVGGSGTGGGMMKNPVSGAPAAWMAYVDVDDVADATKKARSLGGNVVVDVTEIPGYGSFSVIADPTGGILGLWTAAKQ